MLGLKKMGSGVAFAVGLAALGLSAAHANSIQIFSAPTTTPSGLNTTYTYSVTLTSGNIINTGDVFVLVDFTGYVPGTAFAAPGWSFVSAPVNFVVPYVDAVADGSPISISTAGNTTVLTHGAQGGVALNDGPDPDLLFKYTGAPTLVGSAVLGNLGLFGADSTKHLFNLTGNTILGADIQTIPAPPKPGANGDPYITPGDQALPTPLPAAFGPGLLLLSGLSVLLYKRRNVTV